MTDPNDTFEDDLKTIQYNKAIDALIPIVKDESGFFDAFIMDEFEDIYNSASEDELKKLHHFCSGLSHTAPRKYLSQIARMVKVYLEYVEAESERRAIG